MFFDDLMLDWEPSWLDKHIDCFASSQTKFFAKVAADNVPSSVPAVETMYDYHTFVVEMFIECIMRLLDKVRRWNDLVFEGDFLVFDIIVLRVLSNKVVKVVVVKTSVQVENQGDFFAFSLQYLDKGD